MFSFEWNYLQDEGLVNKMKAKLNTRMKNWMLKVSGKNRVGACLDYGKDKRVV